MPTILLLEDDPTSLSVLTVVLRDKGGYDVLTASGVDEALSRCEAKGAIDLLVADVILRHPEQGRIVTRLRELRPEMRVLLISGYTPDQLVERRLVPAEALGAGGAAFLQKPFAPSVLLERVRDVLGSAAADAG